jgi:protein-tyrosine phosphatase
MLNFFKIFGKSEPESKQQAITVLPLVDIHSHLLPGIDDGAKDLADSATLIKQFVHLGYQKLITTPHIMGDFYRNTPEIILEKLEEVRHFLQEMELHIQIEAAAEYYLDEWFIHKIEKGEKILTFGDGYVLFETGFHDKPKYLKETVFNLQASGYKPVWAHPERYTYLYQDSKILEELYECGVFLQINLNSLAGYYHRAAKDFAEKLIEKGQVHFIGSDCHHFRHLEVLKTVRNLKSYSKLCELNILNAQI